MSVKPRLSRTARNLARIVPATAAALVLAAGLRGGAMLGAGFTLPFSADIGAGSSDLTYQVMGGASMISAGAMSRWAIATSITNRTKPSWCKT